MRAKMAKVRIIYKSGAFIDVECENCSIKKDGPELVSITLDKADPRPLLFGLHEIAAVWVLKEN